MKRIIPILIAILICFGVGCTASYFQSESILNWYPALEKPSCTPPDIAFPIAWSFYLSVHGNFYRVDLAYMDNKTTNDYQIIRIPASV